MIFRCDKYDKGKHQREAINGIMKSMALNYK